MGKYKKIKKFFMWVEQLCKLFYVVLGNETHVKNSGGCIQVML